MSTHFSPIRPLLCLHLGTIFTALLIFSSPQTALARPEYAVRISNNRCTSCHYSAAGGGPKNLNGKYYGAQGFKLSPFSAQPYAGADIKWLFYAPNKHSAAKGGMAAMAASPWAAIPLYDTEDFESHVVYEQNIGGFALSGPRNLYLRYQNKDATATGILPQTVIVGRFIPAYGLMTDEHDTYVRLQTLSTWNMGIRMGAMLSGNIWESLHYDWSLLNGQENQGTTLQRSESSQFGTLFNLRWLPQTRLGFLLGASAAYYEAPAAELGSAQGTSDGSRSSQSVYGVLSLHRVTNGHVPLSLLAEYSRATNMNLASWTGKFISNPDSYQVDSTHSTGWLAQLNYDIGRLVVLTYKYDRLRLDDNYAGDVYQRHGFGVKHFFGPNMWVQLRYDRSTASHPNEEAGTGLGGNSAYWAVLSVNI